METLSPETLEDLRSGRASKESKLAVCAGNVQMSAVERIEILTILAEDVDKSIAESAQSALVSGAQEVFVEALGRQSAAEPLFQYAAKNLSNKPVITEALLKNKNCPGDALVPAVPHMTPAHVQSLVEELDRLTASPALAEALEHSTSATLDQKMLLQELKNESFDPRLAEAAEEAEPDPVKRQTLLQQISRMTVAQRVQFALKGGSEARRTLIRDSNKVVQRAVLQSPRLTDQEVEGFASMSSLTDEILRLMANNRNFRKNYVVVRNLMNNAKTPLDVTLHMLPMLNPMDLKKLSMNKNVPETLRTTSAKLIRTRTEQKK